jgi:hypothetical protein
MIPVQTLRPICAALALLALGLPGTAGARVMLLFHSFNGSLFFGRFPHAFIELSGTLDADGRAIHENYGYTAVETSPAILSGNVVGTIHVEEDRYLKSTNVHFAVPISDAQYAEIRAEVARWRDAPGKAYNLETHNCVNFVARIAEMVGLTADVPHDMEKRPKAWLNYIATRNPQLHAPQVR